MASPELPYLSLGRVATDSVEDVAIDSRVAERSPQGRVAKTGDRSHCEGRLGWEGWNGMEERKGKKEKKKRS